jgi:hypothetical protein
MVWPESKIGQTWSLSGGVLTVIKRLLNSEAAWRYVDAYFPRIFGLIFHTYLLRHYGGDLYALPGWLLGILGLCMAFVPDPHSYILVRAHGKRAQRLLGLTTPWLLIKVALCTCIATIGMFVFATGHLIAAHGATWLAVFAAATLFGSVEFLWAVLGSTSLATGSVKRVALSGVIARLTAISFIALGWLFGTPNMALDFFLVTCPVLLVWVSLSPWRYSLRRSRLFFIFSLRRYTGWNQGIALATNTMFQLPLLIIGMYPAVGAATVGQIAYIARLLQAVLQPFQILQSIVIKDAAQVSRGVITAGPRRVEWLFRVGSVGIACVGFTALSAAVFVGNLIWITSMLALAMVAGVAVSVWHRYELAKMLATPRLKELFLFGYLPVIFATALLAVLSMHIAGLIGLAFVTLLGWIGLSISWMWTNGGTK